MNCCICKQGILTDGHTTMTLECDGVVLAFKQVPAHVCETCGEADMDEAVTRDLLALAERAVAAGVEVDVRHYVAA
ncbi:YgiT-type zinc finger protein [Thiocapsa rosea]|uniref:YgiT-type zinc finger domain-containing protein n=1 Tax=Thiocapsa rosea TaxID=69360 RepID=A0A495VEQ6_9GAMM|nr:YgiT-type zinc finger protein [Thiocapsa rosea]RKT46925.1 YgiT-type zinc finger domain-containing protein [Thiocapsa rosea]